MHKPCVMPLSRRDYAGIDRIVPVGKAMDIGVVWDGHELIREASRLVING